MLQCDYIFAIYAAHYLITVCILPTSDPNTGDVSGGIIAAIIIVILLIVVLVGAVVIVVVVLRRRRSGEKRILS